MLVRALLTAATAERGAFDLAACTGKIQMSKRSIQEVANRSSNPHV